MSDNLNEGVPRGSNGLLMKLLGLGVVSALIGYGAVYVSLMGADNRAGSSPGQITSKGERSGGSSPDRSSPKGQAKNPLRALATGDMGTFVFASTREAAPELKFVDGAGAEVTLDAWKGKHVLVNLWATWCAPCRKEMPALSRLKTDLGGDDFDVLALSIDADGVNKPRRFLAKVGISNLTLYNKPGLAAGRAFNAIGMPTTILIDPRGRIVGRLAGPAEWDSNDAKALIRGVIKAGTS